MIQPMELPNSMDTFSWWLEFGQMGSSYLPLVPSIGSSWTQFTASTYYGELIACLEFTKNWKSMMESYAIAGAFSFILMFLALMHFTMVCNLVCCITKSSKMTCTSLWGAMQLFFPNLLWEFCFTYEAHGPYQIWVASNVSCFIKMW